MAYEDVYRRSIEQPEAYWAEQAEAIHWQVPPQQILEYDKPPFRQWFVGGETNLCYNAVDRHLAERGDQLALVGISTETHETRELTYRDLYREVNTFAAVLQSLDVQRGDRVVIYLPHTPEAAIAMLACARIGAIHSVVFGGFAAHNLALRIDDAQPKLLICADAGIRGGKVIPYKPLVDEALAESKAPPPHVLVINRKLASLLPMTPERDVDYDTARQVFVDAEVPVAWLESNEPSYILYTSGTTGKPKGVQRDVGGYAVALALSMRTIYDVGPGQVMFSTSDVGWVVGHSYNVYGPLIVGATSILYEGLPTTPDAGIWWKICENYGVRTMFSSPTAIRALKKFDAEYIRRHDLSALHYLFLAGEPLDEPTADWIGTALGKPVIDNYWQTETGWPILAICRGVEQSEIKLGSPAFPVYGYDLRLFREDGSEAGANEKGIVGIVPPLPPGCLSTVWGQDERFVSTYFSTFKDPVIYSSSDWGIHDDKGYYTILGRMDDVINVAGHRLGTREIEEAVQAHPAIAEVAVVGVADQVKGQMPMAFAVVKSADSVDTPEKVAALEKEVMKKVDGILGAIARPGRVHFISGLPKTRSGKMLRRSIQALAEGRDPGDLTTIDDPSTLEQIRDALKK